MVNNCQLCHKNNFKLIIKASWPIKRCLTCGLVQTNPLPSKKEVNALYQGDYYKNFAPYLSQLSSHQKYFYQQLKEIKKFVKTGRLLDLGCALGPLLVEAEKQGFAAEGVDISSYAVKYCRKHGLAAKTGTVFSVKKNNYYDVVAAFELIEHEREPLKVLQAVFQLLKKNGLIVISTPNYNSLSRKLFGRFWIGYRHREHLYFFSPKTIATLLKKSGFKNIIVRNDVSRPYTFDYFFRRLADYLPFDILKQPLLLMAKLTKNIDLSLPINPWGNLIVYGRK